MEQVEYTVAAMSCGHCVATIERVLREIDGVGDVKVDLDTRSVKLSLSAPATRAQVESVLTEWGYPPAPSS